MQKKPDFYFFFLHLDTKDDDVMISVAILSNSSTCNYLSFGYVMGQLIFHVDKDFDS